MKYGKRLLGLAGVLAATGAVALSALPAASAAPAHARPAISGIEHFQLMSTTGDTNHSPVIATGLFTAGGRDHVVSNNIDKFVFPKGTITVRHSNSKGPQSFNPRTCLLRVNQHGTYKILSGTGAYAGITGHGGYKLTILAVTARGSNGKCTMKKRPAAIELEIQAKGPASL
jgi:hypothetical protein